MVDFIMRYNTIQWNFPYYGYMIGIYDKRGGIKCLLSKHCSF